LVCRHGVFIFIRKILANYSVAIYQHHSEPQNPLHLIWAIEI
jgi:hypothetical protein